MKSRGYLSVSAEKLLKSGVVFKPIKLAMYGMRKEDLDDRLELI